ncbi:GIY-YIG nuclease family protein (plasmid) [Tistrella mobilis]|uniref:GIY-YIG nuclease family protein n=1 Tax=Tistrella mobilis TaxID=171437 RepID=UPI003557BF18
MDDLSDDDILAELGVSIEAKPVRSHTPREERIIAGFEDIVRFREEHGRAPRHGEDRDIFERLYAVRLDRIRALPEAAALLAGRDPYGLLTEGGDAPEAELAELDDDALLAEIGAGSDPDDITVLRHVASREERRAAEEIANRTPCRDFARFKPAFEAAEADLRAGLRQTRLFGTNAAVAAGDFFILGGQMVLVAEVGRTIRTPDGKTDARLRVIYDNGTESNLLLRSLQRALYKDESGRRLTEPAAGPLFSGQWEDGDQESGTIYVLRSLSTHPYVDEHRMLIHKIGVTGGTVEARIADAAQDPTYLLAAVEIIATYRLSGINRVKLENLLHRIFAPARLDLTIQDRFGNPVRPREWFLVPLPVIDEAVARIRDGSIAGLVYDPETVALVPG